MVDEEVLESTQSMNGKAIGALVLGLIGMTGVLFVAAIVAIVLGKRARHEIEQTGQGGAALATTGIVLGWISVSVAAVTFLFVVTEVW